MRRFQRVKLHFRRYYPSGHDALIGGESKSEFAFMRLTHSSKSGHKNNLPLIKNPSSKKDSRTSFLTKVIEVDDKKRFSPNPTNKVLSEEDKKVLEDWFNNNKLFKK